MKKKILLIGDSQNYCASATKKLKEEYEVEHVKYLRTAFIKKLNKYQLVIIEVMSCSSGLYTKKETCDDLRTGIVYYEKEVEALGVPVLFWSWSECFCDEIKSKNNPLLGFVHKTNKEDFLVDAVYKFLESIN